ETAAGLGREDRSQRADVDVAAPRRQSERGARQIDGDSGGIVDRKSPRLRRRPVESEAQFETLTGERLHIDPFEASRRILRLGRTCGDECRKSARQSECGKTNPRGEVPAVKRPCLKHKGHSISYISPATI